MSRKIIYLDQFAISNMMKALNRKHPRHAVTNRDPFWVELFEVLERVTKLQLVACPESDLHRLESSVCPWFEELQRMRLQFSCRLTLKATEELGLEQLIEALNAWLEDREPVYALEATKAIHGQINAWNKPLIISVSAAYPQAIVTGIREFRDEVHRKTKELFDQEFVAHPNRTFEYWYLREREAGPRAIVQSYGKWIERAHAIRSGAIEARYEKIYQSYGLDQFMLIVRTIEALALPEERAREVFHRFLRSDQIRDYPASRITSLLWAAIARSAAAGQRESPNQGTGNDIRLLTLAPFCDAAFVDNGCRALWQKIPKRYRMRYRVKLFSPNTRDAFLAYLRETERDAETDVITTAREIYGEPKPYFGMYEYEEQRSRLCDESTES